MKLYQEQFIQFLLTSGVLKFGDFTTKSGRQTPYFINTGDFKTGKQMSILAGFYASHIAENFGIDRVENLYGPAYKGIPLSVAVSMKLSEKFNRETSFTFNRKEVKDHGEGGLLVGDAYDTKTRVLIIEDVVTAGTSFRETMSLLSHYPNADVIGLIVAVDRKEKLSGENSALEEIAIQHHIKTDSIISIEELMEFVASAEHRKVYQLPHDALDRMKAYRLQYGTTHFQER